MLMPLSAKWISDRFRESVERAANRWHATLALALCTACYNEPLAPTGRIHAPARPAATITLTTSPFVGYPGGRFVAVASMADGYAVGIADSLVIGAPGFGNGYTDPAVIWATTPGAPPVPLNRPFGTNNVSANAVNASGVVVGSATYAGLLGPCGSTACATVWAANGSVTATLPTPIGYQGANALVISSNGIVGGGANDGTGFDAVLWTNGVPTVLPSVATSPRQSLLYGVNANGVAVGVASGTIPGWPEGSPPSLASSNAPVKWENGIATILPLLPNGTFGVALGINNDGVIIGRSDGTPNGGVNGYYAVRWIGGVIEVLPGSNCTPWAINTVGDIVGACGGTGPNTHAILWRGGVAIDLGSYPYYGRAHGISSDGSLVLLDYGINQINSTLLRVTPPPGTTDAGTNVAVTPIDPATGTSPVTLTFASVTVPGTTTITSSGTGTPPPASFKMGNPPVYYELQTTATFSGAVTVCFGYTPSAFSNPANLRLFHGGAGGSWTDVTTSNDAGAGIICGSVSSFSPFILAELSYNFVGFFQPIDNPGTTGVVNTLKAGSAVAVKFSLGGNFGTNVLVASSPASSAYTCGGGTEDSVEETVTAGASSFTYDVTSGQYIYVWKTDKAWAGTCRKLLVNLADGTSHLALFKLTR